jgi:hypothetical protein
MEQVEGDHDCILWVVKTNHSFAGDFLLEDHIVEPVKEIGAHALVRRQCYKVTT